MNFNVVKTSVLEQINPLQIQTSSAVFSLVTCLLKDGADRGAVIGIGNDVCLWSILSCHLTHLAIFESNDKWREVCLTTLDEYRSFLKAEQFTSNQVEVLPFSNCNYRSAQEQAMLLRQENISLKQIIRLSTKNHPLLESLIKSNPDWIYVDGPLGGYSSEDVFQTKEDRGRMETIVCAATALSQSQRFQGRWLIIDDCHRYIEKRCIEVLQSLFETPNGISLSRNTLAFKVKFCPSQEGIDTKDLLHL